MGYLEKVKKQIIDLFVKIREDKKTLFFVAGIIIFIVAYTFLMRPYLKKRENLRNLEKEQIRVEQVKKKKEIKLKNATFSRINFFLGQPIKVSLAIPSYLEGNYRMKDSGDKTVFSYIKNPEFVSSIFYLRYEEKDKLVLKKGEKEAVTVKSKKDGKVYTVVYYIYPESSYKGEDKEGFGEIIWDIKNVLIDSLKAS